MPTIQLSVDMHVYPAHTHTSTFPAHLGIQQAELEDTVHHFILYTISLTIQQKQTWKLTMTLAIPLPPQIIVLENIIAQQKKSQTWCLQNQ